MSNKKTLTNEEIGNIVLNQIFPPNTKVLFVGANLYKPFNGWEKAEPEELDFVSVIFEGDNISKEFVIQVETGYEYLLQEISNLTSKLAWGVSLNAAMHYLKSKNIKFEIKHSEDAPEI